MSLQQLSKTDHRASIAAWGINRPLGSGESMDVPTRGNRRQVGYLLVRAFVSFIGLGWHGWLTFSCRQVLFALAVPFLPVSLGQGEAVSSLPPLSEAGPLPCFVPVLSFLVASHS